MPAASSSDHVPALLAQAHAHAAAGDYAAVIASLRAFLRATPPDKIPPEALRLLGTTARAAQNLTLAAATFTLATRAEPDNSSVWNELGVALSALARWEKSLAAFKKAHALEPPNGEYAFNLACVQQFTGRLNEAIEIYNGLLRSGASGTQVQFNLASALFEAARFEEAWARFNYLTRNSSDPDHKLMAGFSALALYDTPAALDQFRQARSLRPKIEIKQMGALARVREHEKSAEQYRKSAPPPQAIAPSRAFLRSSIDWQEIARSFNAKPARFVVVDDFFDPDVLAQICDFANRGEWEGLTDRGNEIRSSVSEGFFSRVLLDAASAVRKSAAPLIGNLPLTSLWIYKYFANAASRVPHADVGKISFNIWITPDRYNKKENTGGLSLWPVRVKPGYFGRGHDWQERHIEFRLRHEKAEPHTIPYKCNRALIFDSTLIHRTETFHFDENHIGRRANITLAFGAPAAVQT